MITTTPITTTPVNATPVNATPVNATPINPTALFTESDLVSVTARAVAVPLREIYGLLWRAGVLEIVA